MPVVGNFDTQSAYWSYVTLSLQRNEKPAPWRDQYRMLMAYYLNNGLYEVINVLLEQFDIKKRNQQPLRNPAFRVAEFYAAKLWPGPLPDALPIVTDNNRIAQPIQQLWTWSNWASKKQAAARWFAIYGDMFLKVAANATDQSTPTRVYLENIRPTYVSRMETDSSDTLTFIRIDIPRTRKEGGQIKHYTYSEVWTLDSVRIWRHTKGLDEELERLGAPDSETLLAEMNIDFIPIVWQPFRDVGDDRGVGAFTLQLDKIDEANRQANRLHQMLYRYNRALWAISANANDPSGRPLPPPRVGNNAEETLDIEDDTLVKLPGMSTLHPLVPNINFGAALSVLQDHMEELKADLPELAYYNLREHGDLSGIAVQRLLGDTIDRLLDVRGNGETALIRAHKMALTIGSNLGLFGDMGTYENGDFDHTFQHREPFPLTILEKTNAIKTLADAGMPVLAAARFLGIAEEELAFIAEDLREDQRMRAQLANALLDDAQSNFDRGE